MDENGARSGSGLRTRLVGLNSSREEISKAWLVEVIRNSDPSQAERMPLAWATSDLPLLIGDVIEALSSNEAKGLSTAGLHRAARLSELRDVAVSPGQIAREVSFLHNALLSALRTELAVADPQLFAEAAERLAMLFTQVGAHTVDALASAPEPARTGLPGGVEMSRRLEQMAAATKRYGSPFALLVLDIDGPGSHEGDDALGVVSEAVRRSIRVMDEAYRTEQEGFCVLAPHQTSAGAAQMASRITQILERLERASALRITISTGVVGCPEHGDDPSRLLHAADTAMWRARATGQPFTVAA